jgi:hypothetical protein
MGCEEFSKEFNIEFSCCISCHYDSDNSFSDLIEITDDHGNIVAIICCAANISYLAIKK